MHVYLSCYQQLFLLPLAAESSADVSNVSEIDYAPQGKYNYVKASTSYLRWVISSTRSPGREKQSLKLIMGNNN